MTGFILVKPLVQRETGKVVAYQAFYRGELVCFGKTHLEAFMNALNMGFGRSRKLTVDCHCLGLPSPVEFMPA